MITVLDIEYDHLILMNQILCDSLSLESYHLMTSIEDIGTPGLPGEIVDDLPT